MAGALNGKVALVAGATRGAGRGIAIQLGAAGATVYATGRTTRAQRSEMNRPETIEETAELVTQAGGEGIAVQVDHLEPDQVRALVEHIDGDHGRLDVLVNDVWGGDPLAEWNKPVWEHSLDKGLRLLRLAVDTHIISSHFALPLLIRKPGGLVVEITDGTAEYNATYRGTVGLYYDLAKISAIRLALVQADELAPHGATAVSLTPGWLRSEMMLEGFGGSPRTTGATPPPSSHTSSSPNRRITWAARSPPLPQIPRWPAGTGSRFPAATSRRCTASPISTAASPMHGAISARLNAPASPPTPPGTDDRHLGARSACGLWLRGTGRDRA
jgi:NAD(P)-dependent dehydrogenase (short-subunit alcohol dehydrogenase family)